MSRPFVYTEVDSRWARPGDRVRVFRLVVRAVQTYEGPEYAAGRRKAYWLAVKHFLNPVSRVSWHVASGGSFKGEQGQ